MQRKKNISNFSIISATQQTKKTDTNMASCSSLLSEDQFQCSICLDVFTDPVSTSCGHNFCKACITKYWDSNELCQCPVCKMTFDWRPDLCVNTFISEMAAQFRKPEPEKDTSTPNLHPTKAEMSCDICTETKLKAMKSCLVCLTSYCETHLEPHKRVITLKKHKLINPVENLEDRMCKKHDKLLELFCRKEQTCVCVMCIKTDHKTHCSVTLEEEYERRKTEQQEMMAEMNQMIEARSRKIQEIKLSIEILTKESEREVLESVQVFTALVRSIERHQAELIEMIEEKQKEAEKQADMVIKELQQEISDLKKRSTELEQLSHTEDHLHLLQSFPSLSTPPHTKDWSGVSAHSDMSVGAVRRAVAQLEETLKKEIENLSAIELTRIQQYAVDVTLDPDTAHPCLILSEDGKQVRDGDIEQDLPDKPERFDQCVCVLGKHGFYSGKFYYEAQVKGETSWGLGVARESVKRKTEITPSPEDGFWTVYLFNVDELAETLTLSLRKMPQKVGVFVDYEEGLVSFYDVEARSHIYSFTGCTFTERLYPVFTPCVNYGGANSTPLILTLVTH